MSDTPRPPLTLSAVPRVFAQPHVSALPLEAAQPTVPAVPCDSDVMVTLDPPWLSVCEPESVWLTLSICHPVSVCL